MPELALSTSVAWYREAHDVDLNPDAPTLVFLHGWGSSSMVWMYQLRGLRRGARCLAVDLPGHGKCAGTAVESLNDFVVFLWEWLDALQVKKPFLIGHGMGGAIALQSALHRPAATYGVVAVATGPVFFIGEMMSQSLSGGEDMWGYLMRDLLFSPSTPERFVHKSLFNSLQISTDIIHRDLTLCRDWELSSARAKELPPVLCLVGCDDALTPVPLVDALARRCGSTTTVIDSAGHMVMMEQHKLVNEQIASFIAKQREHG